jgi:Transposase and inactivated derivatives
LFSIGIEKGTIRINDKPSFYIGIDTHSKIHTLCIINIDIDKLLTFTFKNQPEQFEEVLQKILQTTKSTNILFGLEDVNSFGLLFSLFLNDKGYDVKHVNPAYASAYRASLPNFHKSDDYDAFCVAKVLRDSYKQLPSFHYEQVFSNIRLLVAQRTIITKQKATNYKLLHQQLSKVYPRYSEFFSTLQTRSALAFFKHFPSSRHLKGYTKEELTAEMKEHTRIFRITTAEKILRMVRANPIPYDNVIVEETIMDLITSIFEKEQQIAKLEKQLEPLIEETGYQLHTIPGINIATAAMLISEIGNIERFKTSKQLSKFCGIAPVSIGSGGKNIEQSSKGGNRVLRATFYFIAMGSVTVSKDDTARHPLFRDYYLRKLLEGKSKSQALVCIMRQLVDIIFSMMKHKTEWKQPDYVRQIPSAPLKDTVLKKKH